MAQLVRRVILRQGTGGVPVPPGGRRKGLRRICRGLRPRARAAVWLVKAHGHKAGQGAAQPRSAGAIDQRKADGTYGTTTYKVPNLSRDLSSVKNPGHGSETASQPMRSKQSSTVKNQGMVYQGTETQGTYLAFLPLTNIFLRKMEGRFSDKGSEDGQKAMAAWSVLAPSKSTARRAVYDANYPAGSPAFTASTCPEMLRAMSLQRNTVASTMSLAVTIRLRGARSIIVLRICSIEMPRAAA